MKFPHPRQRLRDWWQSRLPAADTLLLTQRNVYILPSRAGWLLGATLAVLLLASINYQLNLGYLLTFLLAGCALVGMHVGHGTLRGLRLALEPPQPVFAGASASLVVVLSNDRRRPRHGIGLALDADGAQDRWVWCELPAQGSTSARLALRPAPRGLHALPLLRLQTRYPMGTFRVWALWRPAARVLVWPAPEAGAPPLPTSPGRGGGLPARAAEGGEFDGVRAYRRGDAVRHLAWKKLARAGELVTRETQQVRHAPLWLDLSQAGRGDLEQRLSRLAAWVLQADRLGLEYGLRLPGRQLAPARGEAHKRQCLEALALC